MIILGDENFTLNDPKLTKPVKLNGKASTIPYRKVS
tara:strand:+ start:172 stop:279 length:108 start_codon:yes stop_codon:yes gene_type:complete